MARAASSLDRSARTADIARAALAHLRVRIGIHRAQRREVRTLLRGAVAAAPEHGEIELIDVERRNLDRARVAGARRHALLHALTADRVAAGGGLRRRLDTRGIDLVHLERPAVVVVEAAVRAALLDRRADTNDVELRLRP